jgi:hypothetical protein
MFHGILLRSEIMSIAQSCAPGYYPMKYIQGLTPVDEKSSDAEKKI